MILNSSSPRMRLFQLKCPHRFGSGTPLVMMPLHEFNQSRLSFILLGVSIRIHAARYFVHLVFTEVTRAYLQNDDFH